MLATVCARETLPSDLCAGRCWAQASSPMGSPGSATSQDGSSIASLASPASSASSTPGRGKVRRPHAPHPSAEPVADSPCFASVQHRRIKTLDERELSGQLLAEN